MTPTDTISRMNPVALYFASGESFYVGAGLLLTILCVSPFLHHRWAVGVRNVVAILALVLIVMACPPFPWLIDAIFVIAFAVWFTVVNWSTGSVMVARSRMVTASVLIGMLMVLSVGELSRRMIPVIGGAPSDHLTIIGDSISSSIDPRVPAWPVVMERGTGVPVKNLARPGATTTDGIRMASRLSPEDTLVLIEIGGNDLLSGTSAPDFEKALDALISKIVTPGRTIVMFELPLFPTKIAYGRIQHRLAAKYGVWLIPRRCFVEVLGTKDATSDGLHLSDVGAHKMADLVYRTLSPVLIQGRKG